MAANWIACNLKINTETKTWTLDSGPMFQTEYQKRDYADIAALCKKADPQSYRETDKAGSNTDTVIETS